MRRPSQLSSFAFKDSTSDIRCPEAPNFQVWLVFWNLTNVVNIDWGIYLFGHLGTTNGSRMITPLVSLTSIPTTYYFVFLRIKCYSDAPSHLNADAYVRIPVYTNNLNPIVYYEKVVEPRAPRNQPQLFAFKCLFCSLHEEFLTQPNPTKSAHSVHALTHTRGGIVFLL